MQPANPRIVTINGGSSSVTFALFEAAASLRRILDGVMSAKAGLVDRAM
jgi:acetate kinase